MKPTLELVSEGKWEVESKVSGEKARIEKIGDKIMIIVEDQMICVTSKFGIVFGMGINEASSGRQE